MSQHLDLARKAISMYGAMHKPNELAGLISVVAGLKPKVAFEIGTATGGTLWALSQVSPMTYYVSIDIPGGPFSGGATIGDNDLYELVMPPGSPGKLLILRGDSKTIALPANLPDLVIIDGDHTEAGVRADWERYKPLVRSGGIVAFHDILPHPEVTGVEVDRLWAEIKASESTVEIIDTETRGAAGNLWGGIGLVHL